MSTSRNTDELSPKTESLIAANESPVSPSVCVKSPVVSVTERPVVDAGVSLSQSADELDHRHVPLVSAS